MKPPTSRLSLHVLPRQSHERSFPARRVVKVSPSPLDHVRGGVAVEATNKLARDRARGVPKRNPARTERRRGELPAVGVEASDVGVAVAVEVADAKLASVLGHAIQEAPLRLAAGGKVPARARADEHVIDAVAVEVTDGEICSWIGGLECVGPNHMLRGIRCGGDDGGSFGLKKNVVVNRGEAARRPAIVDIFMAGM